MAYSDPHDERLKESRRKHYRANKEAYRANADKNRKKIIEWVNEFKLAQGCLDCHEGYPTEPWLLEFDHLDDKIANVSKLIRNGSLRRVQEEVAKCEVVCVLCHRRRTARRAGWTHRVAAGR